MRIAIVEDNISLRDTLKIQLKRLPVDIEIVFEAEGVTDAIKGFQQYQIDLAILDVEIKGGLIFDALKQLPSLDFEVIFISAHGTYAVNAFQYNAFNFILKPLAYSVLEKHIFSYLKKAEEKLVANSMKLQLNALELMLRDQKTEKIALPSIDGIRFYRFSEISWIQADANYCHFILKSGGKVVVSKPLKEYVDLLEIQGFYRVHKSSLINLSLVQQYIKGDGGFVVLEDGSEVPVSRRKKEGLLAALLKN